MRAAAVILVGACSFTLPRPPDPPYKAMPACNESSVLPLVDLGGIVASFSAALWFGLDERSGSGEKVLGPIAAGGMALYLVAALYGLHEGGECREARDAFIRESTSSPPPSPGAPGAERGECRAGACDAGLTCLSNRCVVWPPH